jgi:hypothetical protein
MASVSCSSCCVCCVDKCAAPAWPDNACTEQQAQKQQQQHKQLS